ncbi:MAG: lamin tail domain-containing protein, partial [Planctomycetota bacterium]
MTIRSDGKGRGARGRWLGALVVCALAAPFGWAAQGEHLVISEVGYDTANEGAGASSEFVEIFNPTDHAIDLSNYYLSDDPRSYALVSDFNYSTTGNLVLLPTNSDFIHRFPDGLTIPSGGVVVVCADAQTFLDEFFGGSLTAFHAQQGYPQLVQCNRNGLASVPRMRPAATNNSQTSNPLDGLSLTNSGEVVILFHWDQSSDLVQDVDVVAWGSALSQSPPLNVDKDTDFGGGVDGPDPDANASMYQPDAGAPASYAAPRVRQGNSIVRLRLIESQEVTSGGNGITGHDESSEDWSVFGDEAASPGTTTLGVPELHVLATQLDFGRVAVGGEASVELAIENTGLRDLVVRGW